MLIGVLALQGDFVQHQRVLSELDVLTRQVRTPSELTGLSGLILPGGESTTMLKFMQEEGLIKPIEQFWRAGGALYGTCAGAILLARYVSSPTQFSLGLLDVSIERNGYGRQINSHISQEPCEPLGTPPLPMVFIRAPVINKVGPTVSVMAKHRGEPVLVCDDRVLASTFHPELTDDLRVHRFFVENIAQPRSHLPSI